MKYSLSIVSICLIISTLFVRASAQDQASAATGDDYRIGCGDVLWISVWQNEKLDKEIVVLPDGKISFPLAGEVEAAGKTVSELKSELMPLLKTYINEPVLTINVRAVNSMFIYVLGQVNNPGRYSLLGKVDVLQALAIAGGLNPFADKGDVRIFRRFDGTMTLLHFNYRSVIKGNRLEQNIFLERGDVIVVP